MRTDRSSRHVDQSRPFLTPLARRWVAAGTSTVAAFLLAAAPANAQQAYVFAGGCSSSLATNEVHLIDLTTGEVLEDLGTRADCDFEGLELVGGRLYGSTEVSASRPGLVYDITDAPGTPLGPAVRRSGVDHELSLDPTSGVLYALNGAESATIFRTWLYTIDLDTGAPTLVGQSGFYADSLAIDASGAGYAVDMIFRESLYAVDIATGALDLVAPIAYEPGLEPALSQTALGFDDDGTLWMIVGGSRLNPTRIYTLDPATGEATFVADLERLTSGAGSLIDAMAIIPAPSCVADLDGDGELTIFDFLAFQNRFDAGDPIADFDGDGSLTIFDFLAFQNAFDAGCL